MAFMDEMRLGVQQAQSQGRFGQREGLTALLCILDRLRLPLVEDSKAAIHSCLGTLPNSSSYHDE